MRHRSIWPCFFGFFGVALVTAGPASAQAEDRAEAPRGDTVVTQLETFVLETVAEGLTTPVAMVFLSDNEALLAQRSLGELNRIDLEAGTVTPIQGLPPMFTEGDGGLLDVQMGPAGTDAEGWLYLVYADPNDGTPVTVLDRARVEGDVLVDRQRLFTGAPSYGRTTHFGGRVAFDSELLFLTVGERYELPEAQSTATYNGTVVRLRLDGTVPDDNPFVDVEGALPEVWSYGHRNQQGIAVNPQTGTVWLNEHGPQGGDEVNVVFPGRNYGWPVITHGEEYGGGPIGEGLTHRPGMEQPVWMYRPSIGPSDMVFSTGPAFPAWNGSALIGALGLRHLNRLTIEGDRVIHEERLLTDREWRIRMVRQDSRGVVYLGTDSGLLVRLRPVG